MAQSTQVTNTKACCQGLTFRTGTQSKLQDPIFPVRFTAKTYAGENKKLYRVSGLKDHRQEGRNVAERRAALPEGD